MNKKITDLSNIKPNDILKVVRKDQPACFCIVKTCHREPDIGAIWGYLSESKKQKINETDHRRIVMIEFDSKATKWNLTLPVRNSEESQYLTSLIEKDQHYEFFVSDIEEVGLYLKDMKNEEISTIFDNATRDIQKIRKTYDGIVNNTMHALVLGEKETV
jgi:hypothetical protein